jgi:release factor glutamine methyltransferase
MGLNIHTIQDIRSYLFGELDKTYHEPEKSALVNIVIKTATGFSKLHQLYEPDKQITDKQIERIIEILKALKDGKPIQYILGETDFYGCRIRLNNETLIPRQETEELVHLIVTENADYKGRIADLGTGSGCIAVALAANIRGASVTGVDISEKAITQAIENAILNGVNVNFLVADIFDLNSEDIGNTGIIVSNPPYVRKSEKIHIERNVLDYEPHAALFVDDSNPLVFYKSILKSADELLVQGGKVYFEINEAMGRSLISLFEEYGYDEIRLVRDINNKDRIIKGVKNG